MTDDYRTAASSPSVADAERRLTNALALLLLGRRKMKSSVVMLGGGPLCASDLAWLGQTAGTSDLDVLHLGFRADGDRVELAGLTLAIPRGGVVHILPDCRLWLPRHGDRALILPRDHNRGHFRLAPRDVVHIDGKPADVEGGVSRAAVRLGQLVARGARYPGQIAIHEMPLAA